MSTQDEAIIHEVGEAIGKSGIVGYSAPAYREHVAKAAIRAYLSALDKAGFGGLTVVPKHSITMGQMDAGERALAQLDLTTATPEQIVQRVYFATVQASPPPPGADK